MEQRRGLATSPLDGSRAPWDASHLLGFVVVHQKRHGTAFTRTRQHRAMAGSLVVRPRAAIKLLRPRLHKWSHPLGLSDVEMSGRRVHQREGSTHASQALGHGLEHTSCAWYPRRCRAAHDVNPCRSCLPLRTHLRARWQRIWPAMSITRNSTEKSRPARLCTAQPCS